MADQDYATVSGTKVHRSDFAYAPEGSGPSEWKLPIHDETHVRNALARFNQTDLPAAAKAAAKAKILARARKYGIDTSGFEEKHSSEGAGGWGLGAGDAPRFLVFLSEPPKEGLIRIPIAITGKWKGAEKEFTVDLDDLKEIRENFAKKPTREINVDYEHASEVPFGTGGPVLSAGRVTKLDEPEKFVNGSGAARDAGRASPPPTNGKYILWGWFEPTTRARELIAGKEYRYISPAIRWGAKDKVTGKTIGTVLTSVALVNKPFLEELPQLHLSEATGDQKILVSLGQLHVPGPVNQISVADGQPEEQSRSRESRI